MKRYLLFIGDRYYPNGGMRDFKSSYDTIDEIMPIIEKEDYFNTWVHVYDAEKGKLIISIEDIVEAKRVLNIE